MLSGIAQASFSVVVKRLSILASLALSTLAPMILKLHKHSMHFWKFFRPREIFFEEVFDIEQFLLLSQNSQNSYFSLDRASEVYYGWLSFFLRAPPFRKLCVRWQNACFQYCSNFFMPFPFLWKIVGGIILSDFSRFDWSELQGYLCFSNCLNSKDENVLIENFFECYCLGCFQSVLMWTPFT